jgi:hypothetical protein
MENAFNDINLGDFVADEFENYAEFHGIDVTAEPAYAEMIAAGAAYELPPVPTEAPPYTETMTEQAAPVMPDSTQEAVAMPAQASLDDTTQPTPVKTSSRQTLPTQQPKDNGIVNDGYKFKIVDKSDLPKLEGLIDGKKPRKDNAEKFLVRYKAENERAVAKAITPPAPKKSTAAVM